MVMMLFLIERILHKLRAMRFGLMGLGMQIHPSRDYSCYRAGVP
jgi:TnpA family transposase